MGRPKTKDRFKPERGILAGLIDDALKTGQRPNGAGDPWTETAFARELNISQSMVHDWRDRSDPTRPVNIVPLLKAFYGDNPLFAPAMQAMRIAWKRGAGIEDDDPPDPRHIKQKTFSDLAHVVTLLGNQPTPDNEGKLIVPYMLRFHCDRNVKIGIKVDGEPTIVSMDIGVTRPLFLVESKDWQPLQDTIFRMKKHPNTDPGPFGDCVVIKGDLDHDGRVIGDPLTDEPHVRMEPCGSAIDGPIALVVKAPRDGGFKVTSSDGAVSDIQTAVLDAIFDHAIPRDPRGNLEVARYTVAPKAAKSSR